MVCSEASEARVSLQVVLAQEVVLLVHKVYCIDSEELTCNAISYKHLASLLVEYPNLL